MQIRSHMLLCHCYMKLHVCIVCKALVEDLRRSLAGMKSRDDYRKHGQLYMKSK